MPSYILKYKYLLLIVIIFIFMPIYSSFINQPYINDIVAKIMVISIAALSLNLILGYAGMISLGHALFLGIGGYSIGILNFYNIDNGWIQLLLCILCSGVLGLIIGSLSIRTTGVYFIMITLAFAQMIYFFFVSLEALGGDDGMNISRSYFHLIDINEDINLYYLICIIFIISLFSIVKIVRSRFGITIQAIKSNEDRAKSLGVNVFKFKISAFVIASIICGLAGFLYANLNEYIAPNIMHWSRSGELIIIVIIGGIGTLYGPIFGTAAFVLLEEYLPQLLDNLFPGYGDNWMIIFGPILISLVFFPKGKLLNIFNKRNSN